MSVVRMSTDSSPEELDVTHPHFVDTDGDPKQALAGLNRQDRAEIVRDRSSLPGGPVVR